MGTFFCKPEVESQTSPSSLPPPPQLESEYHYLLKIVVIGDSGVGKTSILLRFCHDIFHPPEKITTTIGIDFFIKYVTLQEKLVKLQIWDTAGQERFRTITTSYFRGAHGFLLVFDVSSRDTFNNIRNWIRQVEQNGTSDGNMVLIGNKCDHERKVSTQEAQRFADEYGIRYFEVSAKNNDGIEEIFSLAARLCVRRQDSARKKPVQAKPQRPALTAAQEAERAMKAKRPAMVRKEDADVCKRCDSSFSFAGLKWKHNCRMCGHVVCHECSPVFIPLPELGYGALRQRVCVQCRPPDRLRTVSLDSTSSSSSSALHRGARGGRGGGLTYGQRALQALRKDEPYKERLELQQENWQTGSFSVVHKAIWKSAGKKKTRVAVKVYREFAFATEASAAWSPAAAEIGFLRDAEAHGGHPNLVKHVHSNLNEAAAAIHDGHNHLLLGQSSSSSSSQNPSTQSQSSSSSSSSLSTPPPQVYPCLMTELAPLGTLLEALEGHQWEANLPWPLRLRIALDVCEALCFMHDELEVLHFDVKAENVLVCSFDPREDPGACAKLFDLTSAHAFSDRFSAPDRMPHTTPTHTPPEVFALAAKKRGSSSSLPKGSGGGGGCARGRGKPGSGGGGGGDRGRLFTAAVDVFSFGILLAELCLGPQSKVFAAYPPTTTVLDMGDLVLNGCRPDLAQASSLPSPAPAAPPPPPPPLGERSASSLLTPQEEEEPLPPAPIALPPPPAGFVDLATRCWAHLPEDRPSLHQVRRDLQGLLKDALGEAKDDEDEEGKEGAEGAAAAAAAAAGMEERIKSHIDDGLRGLGTKVDELGSKLGRVQDTLLRGVFESSLLHAPSSFVVVPHKLRQQPPLPTTPSSSSSSSSSASSASASPVSAGAGSVAKEADLLAWSEKLVKVVGEVWRGVERGASSSFAGALEQLASFVTQDAVYLYLVDEVTMRPVVPSSKKKTSSLWSSSKGSVYPLKLPKPSALLKSLLPVLTLTIAAAALSDGALGVAQLFGIPVGRLPKRWMDSAAQLQQWIREGPIASEPLKELVLSTQPSRGTQAALASNTDDDAANIVDSPLLEKGNRHVEAGAATSPGAGAPSKAPPSHKAKGEAFRALEALLAMKDPDNTYCGLERSLTKDGRVVFALPESLLADGGTLVN